MSQLQVKIQTRPQSNKLLLEIDAEKLERLAANFGFFNPDFLKSVDKAELDYEQGRFCQIKSLKELRV